MKTKYLTDEFEKILKILGESEDIVGKANNLCDAVDTNILQVKQYMERANTTKWKEKAKPIITETIFSNTLNDITILQCFISNNLSVACKIAIYNLLPTLQLIREKENVYNKYVANLETLIKNEPSNANEKAAKKAHKNWEDEKNALQNLVNELRQELESLCESAYNYINSINSLNEVTSPNLGDSNNSLSYAEFMNKSSKEKAEFLLELLYKGKLAEFLNSLPNGGLVLETDPNILANLGLEGYELDLGFGNENNIIPIRYDVASLYSQLENNECRDLIIEYLLHYANGTAKGQTLIDLIDKYSANGLIPAWKSDKYNPITLIDFQAVSDKYTTMYSEELKEALEIVLNHTIMSTMYPFEMDNNLDINKAILCNSLVLASDFLAHLEYSNIGLEQNIWMDSFASLVHGNSVGGHCHQFDVKINMNVISLFSDGENNLLAFNSTDINKRKAVRVRNVNDTKYYDEQGNLIENKINVFDTLYKGIGAIPKISDMKSMLQYTKSVDTNLLVPGTTLASTGHGHVIIYYGSVVNSDGEIVKHIIADASKSSKVSIQTVDSEYLLDYNYSIPTSKIENAFKTVYGEEKGTELLQNPGNFNKYATRYGAIY